MAVFKKNAAGALERARAALAETSKQIHKLETTRNELLLADQDAKAAALDQQIEEQRRLERGHRDKVALLEKEAEREAAERRAKDKQELIARIEKKLSERDAAGARAVAAIKELDAAYRTMFKLGREIRAAWPWQAHDLPAAVLSDNAITRIIEHELYRIGARPPLLGGMDIVNPGKDGASLPGGRCPKLELVNLPEKIEPLSQVLTEATTFACALLRGKSNTSPSQTGAGTSKLARLLKRQSELAELSTPEAEAEYASVVAEIVTASAEIEVTP